MTTSNHVSNTIHALKRSVEKKLEQFGKRLEKEVQYLGRSLHNAPKRATRVDAINPRKNSHYVESTQPNRVFLYNPDNPKNPIDSGMTVEEYLRYIKRGYHAKGAATFKMRKIKFHERRNYDSNDFVRNRGSQYVVRGGSTKVKEITNDFFDKGTGKFHQREEERIDRIRRKQKSYEKRLKNADRKKQNRMRREIALLERQANHKRKGTLKQRNTKEKKALQKRLQLRDMRDAQRLAREMKMAERIEKERRYRIVVPSSRGGWTPTPLAKTLLRISTEPGAIPKTWKGGNTPQTFLANNWQVKKISQLNFEISIRPKYFSNGKPDDKQFLNRLEKGGTFQTKPVVYGYMVYFGDDGYGTPGIRRKRRFSHKRISFKPLKTKAKQAAAKPHPIAAPVTKKVRQRIINGKTFPMFR